jgi:hypothetical protein
VHHSPNAILPPHASNGLKRRHLGSRRQREIAAKEGLARTPACRAISNADRSDPADEYLSISSVSIPDQETRDLLPAASFGELIGDPFGHRMRGAPKPQDLPPAWPMMSNP